MARKTIQTIALAAVAGALIFVYQDTIGSFFKQHAREDAVLQNPLAQRERSIPTLENLLEKLEHKPRPCEQPILYTIDSFDARFEISRNDFIRAIQNAERIWETPAGRELFAHASGTPGTLLKIRLIYDARQDATIQLRQYGMTIRDSRESYDALKAAYETLTDAYAEDKILFDARIAALHAREDTYNQEVAMWNARGGAPQEEYDRLNAEKAAIDAEMVKANLLKDALNVKVDRINAMVVVLNRLAATLNIQVARYNEIGGAHTGEFEEGVYRSGPDGQEIDIYQFDTHAKLVRVLAHEFGHALGLAHVTDPKAIMYRLNQGMNEKLTPADLAALKNRCGIE